ncbi:transmembrane protein 41A-like [Schistocerca gregaria]|uniref:transmembrane protein 41A-like n=1 Tax=Schistocerca gregaria TaxID=7010 RepID=UPI00211DE422|nr:transmembrane protein 41A-like [Schistocerca gregaria]XP_049861000.1 transmembrane protein 41A-like [Schistocerca gregaria]XP_049861001.1 transmembrane protein 41A-like [Schistocerca gregaria]XP_049861002.1 transmembrane protein 41A-like [Schistocerca gregaria]XP_049861003.1 transmembrane protein 41A-like [Schistocerca gregaria]
MDSAKKESNSVKRIWFLVPVAVLATGWLYFLTTIAPKLNNGNKGSIKLQFPSSLQQMKDLAHLLEQYREHHLLYVVILFSSAYLYKQAFSIPGSALLNVLAGALFGSLVAFPLCCVLTALGASCCYLMSRYFLGDLLMLYWKDQVQKLQEKVASNSNCLLYYLLFLRLFPVTPNWLINLIAPLAGVPLTQFLITVFLGLMPYNFMCVQAGEVLSSITSLDTLFSTETFIRLGLMATASLLPTFVIRKHKIQQSLDSSVQKNTHSHKS